MKRLLPILMTLCLVLPLMAEDVTHRAEHPHMLRLAWGDQHFEHIAWHASLQPVNNLPATYTATYNESFRYTQHWSLEYQNRLNHWFSYGGLVDGSGVLWDQVMRNGLGQELSRDPGHHLYNLVMMPTVYFTYLHHPYVSLHSGLGIGLNINGGSEKDMYGRTVVCAPAVNLTLIGISAWYKEWFASVDLGAMLSMTNGQTIYMFGSRIFSVAIGVTF